MKILLAEAGPTRAQIDAASLAGIGVTAMARPRPCERLSQAIARETPDIVIIVMAQPRPDWLGDIGALSRGDPRPVVLLVETDDAAFMEAAIAAGVSSYTVIAGGLPDMRPIVRAAVALFRRHGEALAELRQAQSALRDRVLIERAKRLLIRQRRMSEPAAHLWLRRQAMARSQPIVQVATELLGELKDDPASSG